MPALALCLATTSAVVAARLLPEGYGPVLVHLGPSGLAGALAAPGMEDVALIDTPAPGYAVLWGEAARIRSALGLTISWQGNAPCSPSP